MRSTVTSHEVILTSTFYMTWILQTYSVWPACGVTTEHVACDGRWLGLGAEEASWAPHAQIPHDTHQDRPNQRPVHTHASDSFAALV